MCVCVCVCVYVYIYTTTQTYAHPCPFSQISSTRLSQLEPCTSYLGSIPFNRTHVIIYDYIKLEYDHVYVVLFEHVHIVLTICQKTSKEILASATIHK